MTRDQRLYVQGLLDQTYDYAPHPVLRHYTAYATGYAVAGSKPVLHRLYELITENV